MFGCFGFLLYSFETMSIDNTDDELGLLRTEQVDTKFQMLDVMTVSELLLAMNEFHRRLH